jgi:hypothetical protein
MLEGRMTLQDWINEYDSITRFHRDPEIDAVVRFMVRKCVKEYKTVNPSTLLATRTVDGLMVPMGTEFEAFMDTSLNFQNALMKLMNAMTSREGYSPLCPPSIDDNADNCLFKPVTTMGEDYGVLQMLVPHYLHDGTEYTIPENVYLHFGFFGDVFSGFGRLNLTASIHADDLNVANKVSDEDLIQLASLGRREMAAVDQMKLHGMTFDEESILLPPRDAKEDIDLDPEQDGITHVNIYSQGNTELGQFLSNFYYAPINLPEGTFNSIEGYWHWLGVPEGTPGRDKLRSLSGYDALKYGRELKRKYSVNQRSDFKEKIQHAIGVKLETYPSWKDDPNSNLPLKHYYVTNDKVSNQESKFGWVIKAVEDEMRKHG